MAQQEVYTDENSGVASGGELHLGGATFVPAVDIYSTDTELILLADMPGVSPDCVEVDINDGILSLTGRTKPDIGDTEVLLHEYCAGDYFRSFRISELFDQSRVTASLADGVLTVVLPKAERAVPRRITIGAG